MRNEKGHSFIPVHGNHTIVSAETLTLKESLYLATRNYPLLRVSDYDEKISEENENIANSNYLPEVVFQGGYTLQQDSRGISIGSLSVHTKEADFTDMSIFLEKHTAEKG